MKARRSSEGLARLYFVDTFDIDPPADKQLTGGRFATSLAVAGCPGSIAIRSRMITAVSETMHKTTSGLPVSLVSLHGKDDLLVLGPAWAIERIAGGEFPINTGDISQIELEAAIETTKTELNYLDRLCELLQKAPQDVSSAAELDWFLRADIDKIMNYFSLNDPEVFVMKYRVEALEHLSNLRAMLEVNDKYPRWWLGWGSDFSPAMTSSGRHISGYPVSREKSPSTARTRIHPAQQVP